MSNAIAPNTNTAPVVLELPNMTLHGFTGTLTLTGSNGREIVDILKAMQQAGMAQAAAPALVAAAPTADAPPVCPVHGKPMKPSRKPGSWFCSAKVGDDYCQEKR